jgi:hypothetical protein
VNAHRYFCFIPAPIMMSLINQFNKLFNRRSPQPEDLYMVTITKEMVMVEHPKWGGGSIKWDNLHTVLLINTNEGPWLPDVWLTLVDNSSRCMIPLGAKGYDEVYEIVSKYAGFNFENTGKSMGCTDNVEFLLWTNKV